MTMIRNVMFGISLLALSGASAFAAPAVKHVSSKPRVVAQAGDTAAPAGDKATKKEKKHSKKGAKGDAAKTEGGKEMKPAPDKAAK
jgi:hypothetical protein